VWQLLCDRPRTSCTIVSTLCATRLSMHVMQHVVRREGNLVDLHAGVKNEWKWRRSVRQEPRVELGGRDDNTGPYAEILPITSRGSID